MSNVTIHHGMVIGYSLRSAEGYDYAVLREHERFVLLELRALLIARNAHRVSCVSRT